MTSMVGLHLNFISPYPRDSHDGLDPASPHHTTGLGGKDITTESPFGFVTSYLQGTCSIRALDFLGTSKSFLSYSMIENIGHSDVCSSNLANKSSDGNRLPGFDVMSLHTCPVDSLASKTRMIEGVLGIGK